MILVPLNFIFNYYKYYKEHLPIANRNDLSNDIDETLVCNIRLRSKKIFDKKKKKMGEQFHML